jgi:putative ABC transport system permease protein
VRRTAPLTSGVMGLAGAAGAVLLGLGLLGFALSAAAGSPDRWLTITRLRTLGLRSRDARWIAAGELLPPLLVTAVLGSLLGVLLARLTLGPFGLRLLTGQADPPAIVVPWALVGLVTAAFLVAVAMAVPVESALRRRRKLGEVLRAGDT